MTDQEITEFFRKWNLYFKKDWYDRRVRDSKEIYIAEFHFFDKCDELYIMVDLGGNCYDVLCFRYQDIKNVMEYKEKLTETKPKEDELF